MRDVGGSDDGYGLGIMAKGRAEVMETSLFDYELPASHIAQEPLVERAQSRLLVLHRQTGELEHRSFAEIGAFLQAEDLLVVNDSRVMPARLYGHKKSGGKVEFLLLEQQDSTRWKVLVGGKRLQEGVVVVLADRAGNPTEITATITAVLPNSERELTFNQPINSQLDWLGHTPLPPYIHQPVADSERYQTVYARLFGSAAAPTAGLHFTPELLLNLRQKGVAFETVTLHIGLDTFKPVEAAQIGDHPIHSEWMRVSVETAKRINETKLAGGRVVVVGTTSMRTLETAAWRSAGIFSSLQQASQQPPPVSCSWKPVIATEGRTDLFIYPGYHFRVVDALITNFHLPQSTLIMLVSAFAGTANIQRAYQTALEMNYRFLSFGDAMLIID